MTSTSISESPSGDRRQFPMPGRLPIRRSLTEDVHEALLTMLMDQVIRPGASVIIDDLARQLSVSPTPVREALARLESEGLVQREQHRGYFAAHALSAEDVDELFTFRVLLEPWCAGRAASRATEPHRAALRAEMASLGADPIGQDYRGYRRLLDHDARLHLLIAQAAGNRQVVAAITRVRPHLHLFRLRDRAPGLTETHLEHQVIVEAILDRDQTAARDGMLAHLGAARLRFGTESDPAADVDDARSSR